MARRRDPKNGLGGFGMILERGLSGGLMPAILCCRSDDEMIMYVRLRFSMYRGEAQETMAELRNQGTVYEDTKNPFTLCRD
jgi:hypothetical protein